MKKAEEYYGERFKESKEMGDKVIIALMQSYAQYVTEQQSKEIRAYKLQCGELDPFFVKDIENHDRLHGVILDRDKEIERLKGEVDKWKEKREWNDGALMSHKDEIRDMDGQLKEKDQLLKEMAEGLTKSNRLISHLHNMFGVTESGEERRQANRQTLSKYKELC